MNTNSSDIYKTVLQHDYSLERKGGAYRSRVCLKCNYRQAGSLFILSPRKVRKGRTTFSHSCLCCRIIDSVMARSRHSHCLFDDCMEGIVLKYEKKVVAEWKEVLEWYDMDASLELKVGLDRWIKEEASRHVAYCQNLVQISGNLTSTDYDEISTHSELITGNTSPNNRQVNISGVTKQSEVGDADKQMVEEEPATKGATVGKTSVVKRSINSLKLVRVTGEECNVKHDEKKDKIDDKDQESKISKLDDDDAFQEITSEEYSRATTSEANPQPVQTGSRRVLEIQESPQPPIDEDALVMDTTSDSEIDLRTFTPYHPYDPLTQYPSRTSEERLHHVDFEEVEEPEEQATAHTNSESPQFQNPPSFHHRTSISGSRNSQKVNRVLAETQRVVHDLMYARGKVPQATLDAGIDQTQVLAHLEGFGRMVERFIWEAEYAGGGVEG